jgi:hypothetical protein
MATALLTNILFWSGVAIGGVVFAALLEVTGGEWSGSLRVVAERFRWFLPISFGSIIILMWRSEAIYPWAKQSFGSPWFRPWFVALRVDVACAVVYACAFAFCRASRRAREDPTGRSAMSSAVAFLIVYALGFSLIAVDAIMSLEPRWTSTLFPAYVFTGNVYAGTAAVAALATWDIGRPSAEMTRARSRDLANLLVAAALFWLYLFWSQFLVIWYGNLTAEVGFVTTRLDGLRAVAWTVLALCCVVPAVVFVPRWGKRASAIKIIAPLILLGMWFERWVLVAPDVPSRSPVLSALVTTAAFAVVFVFSVRSELLSNQGAVRSDADA